MNNSTAPTIRFSEYDSASGTLDKDRLREAVTLFKDNGTLVLENVFSKDFIRELHDTFAQRYQSYLEPKVYRDALDVGDKRTMVTINLEDPFNTPYLYANPLIYPIMRELLGDGFIMNGMGSVVSLPGSEMQHIHRDHPPLFESDEVNNVIPSFALTLVVPLVDITEQTGTTRVYKTSHRLSHASDRYLDYQDPYMTTGSCYLMDYMLLHAGMPNHSTQARPILYNIYSRPWFRDFENYKRQAAVKVSDSEFQKIPDEYKHLYAWTRHGSDPKMARPRTAPTGTTQEEMPPT